MLPLNSCEAACCFEYWDLSGSQEKQKKQHHCLLVIERCRCLDEQLGFRLLGLVIRFFLLLKIESRNI
jgi:hypothetical protein